MILSSGNEEGITYEVKYSDGWWFIVVTDRKGNKAETSWRCSIVPRCGASSLDIDRANNWLEFRIDKMREGSK